MAKSSKLRVMISSRCNDKFPAGAATTLTDIRRELKTDIEGMEIAGRKAFEAWTNEDAPPAGGTWDSWDVCIEAVKDCDILLVLSNGNAGWANSSGDVGICHAEMMTGLSIAPAKVRLIALDNVAITKDAAGTRNKCEVASGRELNSLVPSSHGLFLCLPILSSRHAKTVRGTRCSFLTDERAACLSI